jgi:hypothetical protein
MAGEIARHLILCMVEKKDGFATRARKFYKRFFMMGVKTGVNCPLLTDLNFFSITVQIRPQIHTKEVVRIIYFPVNAMSFPKLCSISTNISIQ